MQTQAVSAVKRGQPVAEVAAAFGVNERTAYRCTAYRWLSAVAERAQNVLNTKPIPGPPSKLQDKHLRWLASAVGSTSPQQHLFDSALWALPLIGAVIKRQFGIKLSPSAVGRAMDSHSIHKARLVREIIETQAGRLKLFFLPPYSPHLNPHEQVWSNVKAHIAKQTVANKFDL